MLYFNLILKLNERYQISNVLLGSSAGFVLMISLFKLLKTKHRIIVNIPVNITLDFLKEKFLLYIWKLEINQNQLTLNAFPLKTIGYFPLKIHKNFKKENWKINKTKTKNWDEYIHSVFLICSYGMHWNQLTLDTGDLNWQL